MNVLTPNWEEATKTEKPKMGRLMEKIIDAESDFQPYPLFNLNDNGEMRRVHEIVGETILVNGRLSIYNTVIRNCTFVNKPSAIIHGTVVFDENSRAYNCIFDNVGVASESRGSIENSTLHQDNHVTMVNDTGTVYTERNVFEEELIDREAERIRQIEDERFLENMREAIRPVIPNF